MLTVTSLCGSFNTLNKSFFVNQTVYAPSVKQDNIKDEEATMNNTTATVHLNKTKLTGEMMKVVRFVLTRYRLTISFGALIFRL